MGASYHAIVIGGGHNGLVAGSYLARSGARTVVLEARSKVGGAVDTSAPFVDHPEIKVSTYSYVMSLMPAFLIEELELAKHGYHVTPFGPYYQAFPDGRSITIYGDDPKKTYESVSQFSVKDAEALQEYEAWIHGVTEVVGPLLHQVPPNLGSLTVGDLLEQSKAAWTMRIARHARGRRRDAPVHDEPVRAAGPLVRVRADEDDHDGRRPDRAVVGPRRARHRLRAAAPCGRRRGRRRQPHRQLGLPAGRHGLGRRRDPRLGRGRRLRDPHRRPGRRGSWSRADARSASRSRTARSCARRSS